MNGARVGVTAVPDWLINLALIVSGIFVVVAVIALCMVFKHFGGSR